MTKIMTQFTPQKHGFHFANNFVNEVFQNDLGSWHTKGLCGGMAFAALDYFYAGLPIPSHIPADFPDGKVPDDDPGLRKYIYNRLMDSFALNWDMFVYWTLKRDHSTWIYGAGVPQLTRDEQFPKLMTALASGPKVIGIIEAYNLLDIGKNHQVVAYGAEQDTSGALIVYIYDNNLYDQEVQLVLYPGDPMFTWTAPGYVPQQIRGFLVENYNRVVPTYIDLTVIQPLTPSTFYPKLGGPADCTFTVKNCGHYNAHLQFLDVSVTEPNGADTFAYFTPDNNSTEIVPSQMRTYFQHCAEFGSTQGSYLLRPNYLSVQNASIDNLPVVISSNPPIVVTCPNVAKWDVNSLAASITDLPPYVESVQALYSAPVTPGQDLNDSQVPINYYTGQWDDQSADTRVLTVVKKPVVVNPTKLLQFIITFSTPGKMVANKVKLTLVGKTPGNTQISTVIPLQGNGKVYWGSYTPENTWAQNYTLTLEIQGEDDAPRYSQRNPSGNVIDANPGSTAKLNPKNPRAKFLNYEPGIDRSHAIEIAPRVATLPGDYLEVNNTLPTASKILLGVPDPISGGAWSTLSTLNLHNATDIDFFQVTYQSSSEDDAYTNQNIVKAGESSFLGLELSKVPPALWILVNQGDGNLVDIDLYNEANTLVTPLKAANHYILYCPYKTYKNKVLSAAIKNNNYATQGAFWYDLYFGYVPLHLKGHIDFNAPAYKARPDLARQLLQRYFELVDLPRPPESIFEKDIRTNFPFEMDTRLVRNVKEFIRSSEAFLKKRATKEILEAIFPTKSQSILLTETLNIAQIARSVGVMERAEPLFQQSAEGFEKIEDKDMQVKALVGLVGLYKELKLTAKIREVNRQIRKITP